MCRTKLFLQQRCSEIFSGQLKLPSSFRLCCSLFLPLRGDFVQLPSTECLGLLCPTFTSVWPVLSISLSCFLTLLPPDYYVGWKSCLTGKLSSRLVLPPPPRLHGILRLQSGLSVFIGRQQIGLIGSVFVSRFLASASGMETVLSHRC